MERSIGIKTQGCARKVDVRLPGKGNSNSYGARPVHLIMALIKLIQTSSLSMKIFFCRAEGILAAPERALDAEDGFEVFLERVRRCVVRQPCRQKSRC